MSKQTEAQRLADELYAVPENGADPDLIQEAASLLRRQDELLKQALEAMKEAHDQSFDDMHFKCRQTLLTQIGDIHAHLEAMK